MKKIAFLLCKTFLLLALYMNADAADIECRCNPTKLDDHNAFCACPYQGDLIGTTKSIPAGQPRFRVDGWGSEIVWIFCIPKEHPEQYKSFVASNIHWVSEHTSCELTHDGVAERIGKGLGAEAECSSHISSVDGFVTVASVGCWFYK